MTAAFQHVLVLLSTTLLFSFSLIIAVQHTHNY